VSIILGKKGIGEVRGCDLVIIIGNDQEKILWEKCRRKGEGRSKVDRGIGRRSLREEKRKVALNQPQNTIQENIWFTKKKTKEETK